MVRIVLGGYGCGVSKEAAYCDWGWGVGVCVRGGE